MQFLGYRFCYSFVSLQSIKCSRPSKRTTCCSFTAPPQLLRHFLAPWRTVMMDCQNVQMVYYIQDVIWTTLLVQHATAKKLSTSFISDHVQGNNSGPAQTSVSTANTANIENDTKKRTGMIEVIHRRRRQRRFLLLEPFSKLIDSVFQSR